MTLYWVRERDRQPELITVEAEMTFDTTLCARCEPRFPGGNTHWALADIDHGRKGYSTVYSTPERALAGYLTECEQALTRATERHKRAVRFYEAEFASL